MSDAQTASPWGRRAARIMVVASQSFNGIAAFALVSAMPATAKHFAADGDGAFFAQMVLVAPAIAIVFGSPLAGQLAKRIGPRNVMLASLLIYVLGGVFGLTNPGRALLIISRILVGLAASFITTLALAQSGEFPEEERGGLIGLGAGLSTFTAITAIIVGGWLTGLFGWNAAFILYLWPLPLLPFIFMGVAAKTPPVEHMDGHGGKLPLKAVAPVYLLILLWAVMTFAPAIEGPFVLASRGMTSASMIGIIIGINGLFASAASVTYGRLTARLRINAQMRLVFAAFLAGSLIVSLSRGVLQAEIGLIVPGICTGLLAPVTVPMLLARLAPRHAATALGLMMSVVYLSQLLDPFLFQLINTVSPIKTFGIIAIASMISLVVVVMQGMRGVKAPVVVAGGVSD